MTSVSMRLLGDDIVPVAVVVELTCGKSLQPPWRVRIAPTRLVWLVWSGWWLEVPKVLLKLFLFLVSPPCDGSWLAGYACVASACALVWVSRASVLVLWQRLCSDPRRSGQAEGSQQSENPIVTAGKEKELVK
eukprot:m.78956 g.78956  ORF g.78956 m.78956 type:complete len:133 (+) comp14606_c0_seq3:2401-2799(+)